jgi:hypothetical protein
LDGKVGFANTIDYVDCSGTPLQINVEPEEIIGCFSVYSNAFGTDIPFTALEPFTFNKCSATTTTTTTNSLNTTQGIYFYTTGATSGTIDWGDGNVEAINLSVGSNTFSHNYPSPFSYIIAIDLVDYSVVIEFNVSYSYVTYFENLQLLTQLINFFSYDNETPTIDFSTMTTLQSIYLDKSALTDINIDGCISLVTINVSDCVLSDAEQTYILQEVYDTGIINGQVLMSNNAQPLGAGGIALANDLINNRGWTVLYD